MADPNAQDILGFPPTSLTKNPDGREPIFKQYRRAVIGKDVVVTGAVTAGQTVNVGEIDLTWVRVTGADGAKFATGFTVDLDAGTVTFSSVVGIVQPVTVTGRAEDMFQISAIAGTTLSIPTSRPLRRAYPAGSTVSSAVVHGDCRARVLALNARASWLAPWAATPAGSPATAVFDPVHHPLVVTNAGTVTDRVQISFSNSTTFTAISRKLRGARHPRAVQPRAPRGGHDPRRLRRPVWQQQDPPSLRAQFMGPAGCLVGLQDQPR